MNHPLIPIVATLIFIFVYGVAIIIIKISPNKISQWKVLTISIVISFIIAFAWGYSETTAQRWAITQCKNSKIRVYDTVLAQGFYEYTYGIDTDLLRAIMDGSFKYVETKAGRNYSNMAYAKYYVSELSDINCQNLPSKKTTKSATEKRQYARRNLPLLKPEQCIAIKYSDYLESKYEYYSNTKNAPGSGNRRVSTKLVREIESKKILAEWKGYSGSSVMGPSERCGYTDKDLPFKKVLL